MARRGLTLDVCPTPWKNAYPSTSHAEKHAKQITTHLKHRSGVGHGNRVGRLFPYPCQCGQFHHTSAKPM